MRTIWWNVSCEFDGCIIVETYLCLCSTTTFDKQNVRAEVVALQGALLGPARRLSSLLVSSPSIRRKGACYGPGMR